MKNRIKGLVKLREEKNRSGGLDKIKKRKQQGKMTARERIEYFFDPHTFVELQGYIQHRSSHFGLEKKKFWGDGVITGFGKPISITRSSDPITPLTGERKCSSS